MIIEETTDLGADALQQPKKYKGFMGISIFHKYFAKKRMKYFFEWGSKQFSEFIILLMDDPDKYNCMIFKELEPNKALEKARGVSDEIKTGYERMLRQLGITNVKIVQFRDFEFDKKYLTILQAIKDYNSVNPIFRNDLFQLMEMGIGDKIKDFVKEKDILPEIVAQIKDILFQYIVEELAAIIFFTETDYPIEIDPTREFSTKKMIYENHFPDLFSSLGLKQRGHIYVHPENILKSTY